MIEKMLKKRGLFRGLSFLTVISLVVFLIPPLPASPEMGRIRGGSVVVYPFQPGPASPELAQRATDVFKLALTESGLFLVLSVGKESPTIRRAIEEERLSEADLDFTIPVDEERGFKVAHVVGADYFVLGEISDYHYDPDVPTVEVVLKVRLFDGRTGTLLREVEVRGVSGERPGFRPTQKVLEEEALRDAAKRAVQALIGPPEVPPPPPRPPRVKKRRVNPWVVLAALGALFLILNRAKRAKAAVEAPSDVRAMALENGVRLTWSPVRGATKYAIYREEVGRYQPPVLRAPRRVKVAEVPATITEYSDYAAQPGMLYTYEVRAIDGKGREGPAATALTPAGTTGVGPRIPSPPPNLRAQTGEASVQLTWSPSPEGFVESYRIYRSLMAQGPFALIGEVPQTYFSDRGLVNGQTYYYRVTAVSKDFIRSTRYESEPTPVISATPADVPPIAPTGLTGRSLYDPGTLTPRVELAWNPNPEPDIVGYNIYRSVTRGRALEGGPSFSLLNKFSRPGRRVGRLPTREYQLIALRWAQTTFVDQTVEPDKIYSYYITAVDRTGQEGSPSEIIEISTNVPPPRVTGLVAKAGDKRVELSWSPVVSPDLQGYNVYRSTQPGGGPQRAYVKLNISPVTATSYLDLNVTNNVTYYYVVTAVDRGGLESPEYSNEVMATPHKPAEIVALSAHPIELSANGISTSTITATVTDKEGQPVAGVKVTFHVDTGTIRPLTAYTNSAGKTSATFITPVSRQDLTATVTALVEEVPTPARVTLILRASRPVGITLTAEPPQITADGFSSSTITADVVDAAGQPVADGTQVTFSVPKATPQKNVGFIGADPSTALREESTSFTTGTIKGRAVASYVAGIRAGTVALWAEAEGVRSVVEVTLKVGPPAQVRLSVTPSEIWGNGIATASISVEVLDQNGNKVADGTPVIFSTSLGEVRPATSTTSSGVALSTLVSAAVNQDTPNVVVRARAGNVEAQTIVSFRAVIGEVMQLTAEPSRIPGNGTSTATIRATITNTRGVPVPNGRIVKFSTSLGEIISTTPTQNGVATAVLQSSLVTQEQTASVRVTYENPPGTTPPTLEQTLSIIFFLSDSILLFADPTRLPADGTSRSVITATVVDHNHNPQPGRAVQFATTLGVIAPATVTTDRDGRARAMLTSDTRAGKAVVTATMGALRREVFVYFDPGPPAIITLSATPSGSLTANGIEAFTITAKVMDRNGNPVIDGTSVVFSTNLGTLSHTTAQTVKGEAVVRITSTKAGTATVTATSAGVRGQITVTFASGPPTSVHVSTSPSQIEANGFSTSIISATVTDAFGNLVEDGTLVSFKTTAGTLKLVNAIEVEGVQYARTSNGVARAILTSTTVVGAVAVITATADARPEIEGFQPGPHGTGQVRFIPTTLNP